MKSFLDEKLTNRWFWSKSQARHTEKLKDIKNKYASRIDNSAPKARRNNSTSKFLELEKKSEMHRNNIKLLTSLTDISSGRRATSTRLILNSIGTLPKPKSLNVQSRKQEAQRIITDNEAMARRLNNSQNLSMKKLDKEWHDNKKYIKNASKAKFRKLPLITQRSRLDERKSSENNSVIRKRTQSLHGDTLNKPINKEELNPLNITSTSTELVYIEPHKPSTDFLVTGQRKAKTFKKNPIAKVSPPKVPARLAPLRK